MRRGGHAFGRTSLLACALAAGAPLGCKEQSCVPGKQSSCACPGGGEGVQACLNGGSGFSACECPTAAAPGGAAAPGRMLEPAAAPGGRSPVPTTDEWNAVLKEVTVRGSSALNCETKMVREWLRVSCRGKNSTGGKPTAVSVTRGGGRGDDFTFTGDGVASLVVRFVEGVDLEASFTWSDDKRLLRVHWPRGAPEPRSKGEISEGEQPACEGHQQPCKLRDGRMGWCLDARCKDICPAGQSYSALDTGCHPPCGAGCSSCMEGLCMDPRTEPR